MMSRNAQGPSGRHHKVADIMRLTRWAYELWCLLAGSGCYSSSRAWLAAGVLQDPSLEGIVVAWGQIYFRMAICNPYVHTVHIHMEIPYPYGLWIESLFERACLSAVVPCVTLGQQYRMRPEISRLIIKHFYPNKLQNDESIIVDRPAYNNYIRVAENLNLSGVYWAASE